MSPDKEDTRGGAFGEIKNCLAQESQEQHAAAHSTPVSALRRAEVFRQNLAVRFETVKLSADAKIVDAHDKGREESTTLHEATGGLQ